MQEELRSIETYLRNSKNNWRWHTAQIISEVPTGNIATYGAIAEAVNRRHNLNISSRNVAWLRGKLYELLGHDTIVPLHRIAVAGDVNSKRDSETTKSYNDRLREKEGSLENPVWWQA